MGDATILPMATKKKAPLKWSMIMLLTLCWLLPLAVIAYVMLYVAAGKINSQTERTIVTSVDNAIRICEMRMDAAVEASRNASYLPTIKECYADYLEDGDRLALQKTVNLFLEQLFPAYRGSTSNAVYQASRRFEDKVMPKVLEIYQGLDTDVAIVEIEGGVYLVRNLMTPSYHPYAVLTMELNKDMVFSYG